MAADANVTTTDVACNRQEPLDWRKIAAIAMTAESAIATSMIFSTAERIDMWGA